MPWLSFKSGSLNALIKQEVDKLFEPFMLSFWSPELKNSHGKTLKICWRHILKIAFFFLNRFYFGEVNLAQCQNLKQNKILMRIYSENTVGGGCGPLYPLFILCRLVKEWVDQATLWVMPWASFGKITGQCQQMESTLAVAGTCKLCKQPFKPWRYVTLFGFCSSRNFSWEQVYSDYHDRVL